MLDEYRSEPTVVGQYLEAVYNENIKIDQAVQREFCWNAEMMNSLIFSAVSRRIYIPAIILAEEKKPNGTKQTYVIDAGQRTETLYRFRYEGYRISSNLRSYMVTYNKKKTNENGYVRDKYGDIEYELVEYDIRKTTYDEWPEELKSRLNGCPLISVIYQDCSPEDTAELVLLYNNHMGMNPSQRALTYVGKFADEIKRIRNTNCFLKNGTMLTESEKKRGIWERVISESVMAVNFFEDWKKSPKDICDFLNDNATEENFKEMEDCFDRLTPFSDKLDSPEIASLFSSKNLFIWMKVFNIFNKYGLPDARFGDFLKEFVKRLKYQEIDGDNWDSIDANRNTKDKRLILQKVDYIEKLMVDFLCINNEGQQFEKSRVLSDITGSELETSISIYDFVQENVMVDIDSEDIELYQLSLDDYTVEIDESSKQIVDKNIQSFVALIAYAFSKEIDDDIPDWLVDYTHRTSTFGHNQKENYLHMKQDFENYIAKKGVAA